MRSIRIPRSVLTLLLLVVVVGCKTQSDHPVSVASPDHPSDAISSGDKTTSGAIITGTDGKDVVSFDSGDRAMDQAMQQATKTLDRFFAAYAAPDSKQERFNLKVTLRSGSRVEYIWLDDLRVEDDMKISGVLLNQPFYSTAHKQGDRISVTRQEVVDWSFIEDGYLIGGYTLRVMFNQYPKDRREALQRQLGYRIDPTKGT